MVGGWFPYGPYYRDMSDPFGWKYNPPCKICGKLNCNPREHKESK